MSIPVNVDGGPGGGGFTPPGNKPPLASKGPVGASPTLLTATGGLFGLNNALLAPFVDTRNGKNYFVIYDPTNFNCEDDCVYNFRLESLKPGRNIDVHKVMIEYRDLGPVKFYVSVTATQYNKALKKETMVTAPLKPVATVLKGKGDKKIHTTWIDLKVVGERPQLTILRKANDGPLSIARVLLVGNSSEEDQV